MNVLEIESKRAVPSYTLGKEEGIGEGQFYFLSHSTRSA